MHLFNVTIWCTVYKTAVSATTNTEVMSASIGQNMWMCRALVEEKEAPYHKLTSSEARMTSMPLEPLDMTSFPLFSARHGKGRIIRNAKINRTALVHKVNTRKYLYLVFKASARELHIRNSYSTRRKIV